MTRSKLTLAVIAAFLCLSLALADSSADAPAEAPVVKDVNSCLAAAENILLKEKDIVDQLVQAYLGETLLRARLIECDLLVAPNKIRSCVSNTIKDAQGELRNLGEELAKDGQQILSAAEALPAQCVVMPPTTAA